MNTKIRPNYVPPANFPSIGGFTNVEYTHRDIYIHVSSVDRDFIKYPNPAQFVIDLPTVVNDVVSVELAAGVVPNVVSAPYIYLDIPELNHIYTTSQDVYFGILPLHLASSADFFHLDKSSTNSMPRVFTPVERRLNILSITLRRPDHSILNLGVGGGPLIQVSFTFHIKTRERKREFIDENFRSVCVL